MKNEFTFLVLVWITGLSTNAIAQSNKSDFNVPISALTVLPPPAAVGASSQFASAATSVIASNISGNISGPVNPPQISVGAMPVAGVDMDMTAASAFTVIPPGMPEYPPYIPKTGIINVTPGTTINIPIDRNGEAVYLSKQDNVTTIVYGFNPGAGFVKIHVHTRAGKTLTIEIK